MTCTSLHDWVYQDTEGDKEVYACAHCGAVDFEDVPEPDWDLLAKEEYL